MLKKLYQTLAGAACIALVAVSSVRAAELPDFTDLVAKSAPAVVNISTLKNVQYSSDGSMPFDPNDPDLQQMPEIFRHFFGLQRGIPAPSNPGKTLKRVEPRSLGSGFIISDDGYILTNNHVVNGADEIVVRLNDRRELNAKLVGADPRSDLALLKINADHLPTVKIGHSSDLKAGQWVVAIGSPFGFDYSVTKGIVSAVGRSLSGDNYVPFIQTDVPINPGNSGGPLFNMDGEVVGINSQIYTRSGGFMGLSFAIPIDVAMDVADQLKNGGHVKRGWLGVVIQEVNRDLAESFGLKKAAGALVAKVLPDSPAEKAGLKEGDVILGFNGQDIIMSSDLPHFVGRVKPNSKATLHVIRDGKEQDLDVTIGLLPDDETNILVDSRGNSTDGSVIANVLHIGAANLTEDDKSRLELDNGVVVKQIEQGPAFSAGVQPGDVITLLNGKAVSSVKDLETIVKALPKGRSVPMQIVRDGSPIFLALRIE
ncbi:serine peptidase [Pokkaliibacter plantistimulans]|uniref:Probable periplasmic serine endoprotease DegP-like n=1 Tax=Pokkaliibacter plantistimulans TaxID=1635171 RepID=A0ABX5LSQ3_9GAMM|nr:DegQ family serine endoprotease [Pokkaliibacter plantistimulans]PXF29674.1 serine peptidase [Pokkaliibacter plantistimulans]